MKKLDKKYIKYITIGIVSVVSVIVITGFVFLFDMFGWIGSSETVTISICENDNVSIVCKKMEESGVVLNQHIFKLYYRTNSPDATIYPGTVTVQKNSSYQAITEAIHHPQSETIQFTIPEGFELREIAKRLLAQELISDEETFYQAMQSYTFVLNSEISISGQEMLAGFLFPDTYEIEKGATCEDIINIMTSNFLSKWTKEHEQKAQDLQMDVQEIITLASIVEREARKTEDFPLVASVFLNRLKIGKPLESCATVQFILHERKPVLSVEDTSIDSPYNTYQNAGLPPAPISAPGMMAIDAVLNPAETDYLYFFTDQNGDNHYAKTFEEHNALIAQFGL